MDNEYYKKHEPIWGVWHIKQLLGEGSFGKVYEIERNDFGGIYSSALKAITIPQNRSEIDSAMANGMDEDSVTSYFRGLVDEIVNEFALMSKLKGNSNVVSYEDHIVIEHTDSIGWDILIRMELLTPLNVFAKSNKFSRKDVIKLGIDMCTALELCQKYNIIHRDVKPENIFVSENGNFKLGDFGIARTIERTSAGLSKKGTYHYMAPEVYRNEPYGSSVDIYSLGLVLYRILNENRLPFLPPYPAPITFRDMEKALLQRVSGAKIEAPSNAEGRLAEIVLKACTYNQAERYHTPMQMRDDLNAILYSEDEGRIIYANGDDIPLKSNEYVAEDKSVSGGIQEEMVSELAEDKTVGIFGIDTYDDTDRAVSDIAEVVPNVDHSCAEEDEQAVAQPQQEGIPINPDSKKKKRLLMAIGCVSALIVIGLISGLLSSNKESDLQEPASVPVPTDSQWSGVVFAYQLVGDGYYDKSTEEKFTLPLENNSSVINRVEIVSDDISNTMRVGQEKDYKIRIKTQNAPGVISYFTSRVKEDGTLELGRFGTAWNIELNDGYLDFEIDGSPEDVFEVEGIYRIRIVLEFTNLTDENDYEGTVEKFYFDRYIEVVE